VVAGRPPRATQGDRLVLRLGVLGGLVGRWALEGMETLAVALLLAGGALVVTAHAIATRRAPEAIDATTEVLRTVRWQATSSASCGTLA
jgi:hypothetical protein